MESMPHSDLTDHASMLGLPRFLVAFPRFLKRFQHNLLPFPSFPKHSPLSTMKPCTTTMPRGWFMQDYDIANLNQKGPFSTRELLVSLGVALLWVAGSMVTIQLLLLPVQGA